MQSRSAQLAIIDQYNPDQAAIVVGDLSAYLSIGTHQVMAHFVRPKGDYFWSLDQAIGRACEGRGAIGRLCLSNYRGILLGVAARERLIDDAAARLIEQNLEPLAPIVHEIWAMLQLLKDLSIVAAMTRAETPEILRDHQRAWGLALLRGAILEMDNQGNPSKNAWTKKYRKVADMLADGENPFDADHEPELHLAVTWSRLLGVKVKGERRDISSLRKKLRESFDRWRKSITTVGTAFDRDRRLFAVQVLEENLFYTNQGGTLTPLSAELGLVVQVP